MVVRNRKKKNKMRGNRTHGWGNTKNRRGSGTRGGVGKAGGHKHKYASYLDHFGGKKALKEKLKGISLRIEELDSKAEKLLKKEKAKSEAGTIVLTSRDSGISRIFGSAQVKNKYRLVGIKASAKAAESIKSAGGSIEQNGKSKGEAD